MKFRSKSPTIKCSKGCLLWSLIACCAPVYQSASKADNDQGSKFGDDFKFDTEYEPIKKIEATTPLGLFREDLAAGKLHFLAVGGYASPVPGVPDWRKVAAFHVSCKLISQTGDDLEVGEDKLLTAEPRRDAAIAFAAQYNNLVIQYLTKTAKVGPLPIPKVGILPPLRDRP